MCLFESRSHIADRLIISSELRLNVCFLNPALVAEIEEVKGCKRDLDARSPVENVRSQSRSPPGKISGNTCTRATPENHPGSTEDRNIASIKKALLSLLLETERMLFPDRWVICWRIRLQIGRRDRL